MHITWKGLLAWTVAGVILGIVIDPEIIGAVLLLSLFVMIPVTVFGVTLYRTCDQTSGQLGFWIAATPLPVMFFLMQFDNGSDAGVVQDIGRAALIGYGTQLLPAALALHYFTKKELGVSKTSDE